MKPALMNIYNVIDKDFFLGSMTKVGCSSHFIAEKQLWDSVIAKITPYKRAVISEMKEESSL